MARQKTEAQSITYNPQQAGALAVEYVEERYENKERVLNSGLDPVDKILTGFWPGDLICMIGYTSNLKSAFMDWLALQALKKIDPEKNEFVAKVTWEQSVEQDTLGWIAQNSGLSLTKMARGALDESEWQLLRMASVRRAATPLWIIGHSSQDFKREKKARPRMTIRDAARGLEYAMTETIPGAVMTPRLVVLDYLQRMRPDAQDGSNRREQMMEAVNLSKDLAVAYGCPVLLGVQACRETLDRDDKVPRIDDGQETSNIEQSADVAFGGWYPIKTEKPGSSVGGFQVTQNLFILRLLKQKLGPAPETFALYVDPERRLFAPLTKRER